ncbi:MAG TPA: hypothetical protein DCK98_06120 [Chloroflexi bacterium]|nr:hypothetical protein [Chloroflexota bacterium]HAL27036.1 hypothetical protein [Chloroflexota bacterium]
MDDRPVVMGQCESQTNRRRPSGASDLSKGRREVLTDPNRVEVYLSHRQAYQVVGRTVAGRWLVVIWIDQPEGRYRSTGGRRPIGSSGD